MVTHRIRETVSIVGAGRVGRALGRRLHELGWQVGAVTGRTLATARASARVIGDGRPLDKLTHEILDSRVVLIATPDDTIPCVAKDLAQIGAEEWKGKVALHTSGSLDPSALSPLAEFGASTGSMHPMQTFSDQYVPELANVIFGIDGSPAALQVARKMIQQMGGVAVRLSGTNKAAYHASASFACAFVLALLEAGTRLLMAQGFKRRQALRALLPLTRQTLDNFERVGPHAAFTGPLPRGDFSTVERHLEALAQFPPEFLETYEALSRLAALVLSAEPGELFRQFDRLFGPARAWQRK